MPTEPNTEKTTIKKKESKVLSGVVNCAKLNVRTAAGTDAEVLTIISKEDTVKVKPVEGKKDWYEVDTEGGVHGFCMKEFITLKK